MTFGLVSFGTALGDPAPVAEVVDEYSTDRERVLGYGYHNVYRCPPETGLTDLSFNAGRQALAEAEVDPGDVDLVLLAITDIAEYLYWDPAASLAHRLGAGRAEALLLTQACTAGVLGLDLLAGKFATHPEYHTALVVAANRSCENYWNRLDTQPMVFSDGAAAAVARRGHPRFRWLVTEVLTDGRFADFYRLDAGGAAAPFRPDATTPDSLAARDAWSVLDHFDYDAEKFERFAALIDDNTRAVVETACERAGLERDELSRFILLNDNQQAMRAVADRLDVPLERTNADLAAQFGHLGAADQLFCLDRYHRQGRITPGQRLALVSRGRGMHWACTILAA